MTRAATKPSWEAFKSTLLESERKMPLMTVDSRLFSFSGAPLFSHG